MERSAMRKQAGKLGGRNDRHSAIVRGLEILVPGNEVFGWRYAGHEIEERSIMRITQRSVGGLGIDPLYLSLDCGQKARDIDPGSGKRSLEFGAAQDGFQFREGGRAHHGNETAL